MSVPPPYMPPNSAVAPGSVPNHLAWAIISTVLATCLCCPIGLIGIVAIVFSTQVNSKLAAGDITGAQQASNNARTWSIVATVLAGIGLLLNIAFFSMGGMGQYTEMLQQMQAMQGG